MEVGFFGKLPSHGDFVRRRVADDFVAGWDAWLQSCLAQSRETLGDAWLDTYLTSPVWRFALAPAVCGGAAVAGLVVPSVDRVGRYFPLTVVWPTPSNLSTLEIAVRYRAGFEHAEHLLLDTLAAEDFDFAQFDRSVMELAAHLEQPGGENILRLTQVSAANLAAAPPQRPRCVPLRDAAALVAPSLQLYGQFLDLQGSVAFWWTDGSAAVAPSWLTTRGLPDSVQYSAMLDGRWSAAGWDVGEAEAEPGVETRDSGAMDSGATLAPAAAASTTASSAHSDRGTVRASNQDAFIDRPDLRLWGVADGMGGLRDGDVASRMVCDSLANTPIVAGLDEQIEKVIGQLEQVNEYLRRSATRAVNPIASGSTVVALLIREEQFAVVWAGDSRAYRLRDGLLSRLTQDHGWAEAEAGAAGHEGAGVNQEAAVDQGAAADHEGAAADHEGAAADHEGAAADHEGAAADHEGAAVDHNGEAITRAVGGEDAFAPDTVRGGVRLGDRFLLCSDGLHRSLDEASLAELLQTRELTACSKNLVAQAMSRGSTDNVTALVVDCGVISPPALTDALGIVSL